MSNSKRHHYVPEMLLNRFTDGDGRLFFFDRKRPSLGVRRSTPTQLFCEGHLYSQVHADGRRTTEVEDALSKIESDADRVIEHILQAARRCQPPRLSKVQRETWDNYFLLQWRRVPDHHRDKAILDDPEEVIRSLLRRYRRRFPVQMAAIESQFSDQEIARMTRNARLTSLFEPAGSAGKALASRGLAIVHILDPRRSLITTSLPVVKFTSPGQTDLRDHAVEMWMPIAPDVMVGVGREAGTEAYIPITDQAAIRNTNLALAMQGTLFAGPAPRLIKSLACAMPPTTIRPAIAEPVQS